MTSFLKKIGIFIAPLLIGWFLAEFLLRTVPNDYKLKRAYLDIHSKEISTLILGHSHAFYGINPQILNDKAFNAAYVSQPLGYDLKLLEKYSDSLTSLKRIIIVISYPSLFLTLENSTEKYRLKNYYLYYGFNDGIPLKYKFETTAMDSYFNSFVIKDYYLDNENKMNSDSLGFGYKKSTHKINFKNDALRAVSRHTFNDTSHYQENINALKKMIAIAKDKKIKVYLITTPTTSEYYENINTRQWYKILKAMERLTNEKDVFYYNFMKSGEFNEEDFRDSDHLNNRGAKKFTDLLNNLFCKVNHFNLLK